VFDAILRAKRRGEGPASVVLLGDIEPDEAFDKFAAPLENEGVQVWFIPGNHDSDNGTRMQHLLGSPLSAARNLHGRVVNINGLRIAGLGGIFREEIWHPDAAGGEPSHTSLNEFAEKVRAEAARQGASLHAAISAEGQIRTHGTSIFYEDYLALHGTRADILVTHEAPSCHPKGHALIDELARSMGVSTLFHGHHHDRLDYSAHTQACGFATHGVGIRGVTRLDGTPVLDGERDAPYTIS
jgi:predicted phosphodiesterase